MNKQIKVVILGMCTLAFILSGCQVVLAPSGPKEVESIKYADLTVTALNRMLKNKDFTFINVHVPWQGNIPKTDLHIAYDQIEQNEDLLPDDKDTKIVVYCLTTSMAKIAVDTLLSMEYSNIWMLKGGTSAWEDAGFPLEK